MKPLLLLIAALISCGSLVARELNVRTLALDKRQVMPEYFLKVGEAYVALPFSAIQPGEVIQASAGETSLPLFESVKSEDGKVTYKVVKEVKLPPGAKGVLLLGWQATEGARYLAIDDDFMSAKYSDWLLVNTAPKDVGFRIGDDNKPIKIDANGVTNYKLTAAEGTGVSVIASAKWGEKVKTFYSTYWPVKAGERGIVIFFYQQGDRMAVRKITDTLLKPKDEAEEKSGQ